MQIFRKQRFCENKDVWKITYVIPDTQKVTRHMEKRKVAYLICNYHSHAKFIG
jgi:hypothetical protein